MKFNPFRNIAAILIICMLLPQFSLFASEGDGAAEDSSYVDDFGKRQKLSTRYSIIGAAEGAMLLLVLYGMHENFTTEDMIPWNVKGIWPLTVLVMTGISFLNASVSTLLKYHSDIKDNNLLTIFSNSKAGEEMKTGILWSCIGQTIPLGIVALAAGVVFFLLFFLNILLSS